MIPAISGDGRYVTVFTTAPSDEGHALISDDEFTAAGVHVRSFGFGVSTDGNQFETCESGCQQGVATTTEAPLRSEWTCGPIGAPP